MLLKADILTWINSNSDLQLFLQLLGNVKVSNVPTNVQRHVGDLAGVTFPIADRQTTGDLSTHSLRNRLKSAESYRSIVFVWFQKRYCQIACMITNHVRIPDGLHFVHVIVLQNAVEKRI